MKKGIKKGASPDAAQSSRALAAVHETARSLYEAGVMTKTAMKGFDKLCSTAVDDRRQKSPRDSL